MDVVMCMPSETSGFDLSTLSDELPTFMFYQPKLSQSFQQLKIKIFPACCYAKAFSLPNCEGAQQVHGLPQGVWFMC